MKKFWFCYVLEFVIMIHGSVMGTITRTSERNIKYQHVQFTHLSADYLQLCMAKSTNVAWCTNYSIKHKTKILMFL